MVTATGYVGWELLINFPKLEFDEAYRRYVLIHELSPPSVWSILLIWTMVMQSAAYGSLVGRLSGRYGDGL